MATLMCLSVVGCGGNPESNLDKKTEDSKEGKELEIWVRGTETDPTGPYLIEAVKKYEEENGIKIKLQFIPHDDVITKWNSAFASGTAPDVIDLGIVHIAERANLKHIIPLDEYYEKWENKDQLIPAMKDMGMYDDKLYAIAHYPDPQIFAYRKDMFEEAGLDPEQPPTDWEQLLEYAQKMTKKDKDGNIIQSGFAAPTIEARFLANILIHQKGAVFADEKNNVPTLTTPEAIETINFMDQLHDCSTVFDNRKTDDHPFFKGTAAMGYIPNGSLKEYMNNNPDMKDKIGVVACVPDQQEATWCGVWFYGITSQSENPDQAFDLISYLTSEEVLESRTEMEGIPSAFKYTEDIYVEQNPQVNQAIVDAIECGYGNPKVSWSPLYEKALDQLIEEVFYDQKSVEQALEDAQESLMKEIE